ncbi:hypothetical protein PFISCL1PPCAC_10758 [Pristionchus fissidentatus]|uniref:Large ribosomal subunit protein mL40 n=1 Tax=Pristionchus fissidentatus TaxID=1538716 RepID=A0AAV5VLG9_9BILA|nr:hypothetical protein PFISCL1PPCAC_10758 [Pristionchus fissidentatus]
MLSLTRGLSSLSIRPLHLSAAVNSSVFMKKQKKMDPEVAKQRETRRRKRLEKEIRSMQKHSKKPKPVDELTLDVKSSKNISERRREAVVYSEEDQDEYAVALKDYTRSRNALQLQDDKWMREAIRMQSKALDELKKIDSELWQKAVQPDTNFPLISNGPAHSPPVKGYIAPDGDYIDTTRSWT